MHRVEHVDVLQPSLRKCVKADSFFFSFHTLQLKHKRMLLYMSTLKVNGLYNVTVPFKYQFNILNMD
jgi:hypothetical protein